MILNGLARGALRLCTTNQVGEDSYCRGGILNIRFGCCCVRISRRPRPTALWRFRASTSNSPSGLSWLHSYTPIRQIEQIYAQQDIQVCEDDHKPQKLQYENLKSLSLLRVSI